MKSILHFLITAATLSSLSVPVLAQFTSGSEGDYGALTLGDNETRTIDMPPDGIFHCTTITLGHNSNLFFNKNAANTPVYLLATGDVHFRGRVRVEGSNHSGVQPGIGGPGGFDGGHGGLPDQNVAGWGAGPGGGKPGTNVADAVGFVGAGSYATKRDEGTENERANQGPVYGTPLLLPLVGGSGGGGTIQGGGGGGGGGAVLVASDTRITVDFSTSTGEILAYPGMGPNGNHGSGGGIRLVAPKVTFTNAPRLLASRTDTVTAHGYVRVDTLDASGLLGQISRVTGSLSIGKNMTVFPPSLPMIEIIAAAGQTVDPAQSVSISVPSGAATVQPVQVRVANFGGTAKLKVVLTPERGERLSYDLDIPNPGPDPATGTANVEFPGNMVTRIDVWTR